MTLCAPSDTKDKGNLGQKGPSDNTKVDFGAKKNHGWQWVFKTKTRKTGCKGFVWESRIPSSILVHDLSGTKIHFQ